jgi:hypothetical protein
MCAHSEHLERYFSIAGHNDIERYRKRVFSQEKYFIALRHCGALVKEISEIDGRKIDTQELKDFILDVTAIFDKMYGQS